MENSNDKLIAALAYPLAPIVGAIVLLSENMKNNPALRKHAVQSIALGLVFIVLGTALVSTCIVPLAIIGIELYYAYQAYQGKDVNIPIITDFCRNQKWF